MLRTRIRPQERPAVPALPQTVKDLFETPCPPGRTIGTVTRQGIVRQGSDREGLIAIDHGALRFQPLRQFGWGRQGIAYGPFQRENGLALAVLLLNGHNASHATSIGQSFRGRIKDWLRGNHRRDRPFQILRCLGQSRHTQRFWKRLSSWFWSSPRRWNRPELHESLAVGWFPDYAPQQPQAGGNHFRVHSAEHQNGELWAQVGQQALPTIQGLQNLPVYYLVVLREQGAAYYAAGLPNTHGVGSYPELRPLAIDPFNDEPVVYAGVHQGVLGQVGFWVDTRVYGVKVMPVARLAQWYGTAQVGDRLLGTGSLTQAEIGGAWDILEGNFRLTDRGAEPTQRYSLALLHPEAPSGLIHTLLDTTEPGSTARLVWRFQDPENYWELRLSSEGCELWLQIAGDWQAIATALHPTLPPHSLSSVQILDDGQTLSCYLNGELLFDQWFSDPRLHNATGLGFGVANLAAPLYFRDWEAHPRAVPLPPELELGSPWQAKGTRIVATDDFSGPPRPLHAKPTSTGRKVWEKLLGRGQFNLTGQGSVQVQASVEKPNPGRTAYTIPWHHQHFADLEVTITPAGSDRGQKQTGRGGLIFWQDAYNYIILSNWLDDVYAGAAFSVFFLLDGVEDIYDAIWTNVGTRIQWGVPYRLRIVFDGLHFLVWINGEPVIYRALTDIYPDAKALTIHRVGLVANWEWGEDTGSQFSDFVARV